MLGLRRELADRHVFDHAPAQRAHRLVGHGDAPVLSQDRTPRPAIVLPCRLPAAPYRASGLVLWHEAADCGAATSRQILRVERTCHGRRGTAESDPNRT